MKGHPRNFFVLHNFLKSLINVIMKTFYFIYRTNKNKNFEVAIPMFIQVLSILCLVRHKHVSLLGTNRKINPLIE